MGRGSLSLETSLTAGDREQPALRGPSSGAWKGRARRGRTQHLPSLSLAFLQKLCGMDVLAGDTGDPPHIYAEEGECERAESLSSLAFSEPDPWASKAAPLEEIYSKSGVPS